MQFSLPQRDDYQTKKLTQSYIHKAMAKHELSIAAA